MRTIKQSAPVQEVKLLGFGSVRTDRPARVKRSVKAKVGDKSPPPSPIDPS